MIFPQSEQSNVGLRHSSFIKNDSGLEQANWEAAVAKQKRQGNRYQNGQEVRYTVDLEFFKQYGPGTYLFFLFTRRLTILMFVMTLLAVPSMVSNYMGGGLTAMGAGSSKIYFMQFSLSNQPLSATTAYMQLHNYLIIIPDAVYSLVFFLFLLNWNKKSDEIVQELKKSTQLPSYYTVEVSNKNLTADQLQKAMSHFGEIQQIAEVKNFDESINISKDIGDITMELRLEQMEQYPDPEKLSQLQQRLEELYKQLTLVMTKMKDSTIKFFVTFRRLADRKLVLQTVKPYDKSCLCGKRPPEEIIINRKLMKVKECKVQPGSILWENVHITEGSRFFRWLLQAILVFIGLVAGFLVISLLNIITPQSTTSSVDVTNYTYATVVAASNSSITQAWCLAQLPTVFIQSTTMLSLCQSYLISYYSTIAISVAISLSVIVIKAILKLFLTFLAKFQRYDSFNQQVSSLIVNLFLTYTFTTFFITFLLQANVLDISFKNIITKFVTNDYLLSNAAALTEYTDLSRVWYADIGYKIVINWLVLSLIPHIFQPILLLLGEAWSIRGAKKERLQRQMDRTLEGKNFGFEDNYANILMIVFVSVMLAGPIPILLFIGGLALLSRYLFWKYYFIRFCKIAPTFDQSLNTKVTSILYWAVIVHLAISIYAYGNTDIFPISGSIAIINNLAATLSVGSATFITTIISRCAVNWLLTGILALILLIILVKTFFVDSIISLVRMCKQDKIPTVMITNNQEFTPTGDRDFITSYRMDHNPTYEDIIAIIKSFNKKI